LACIKFRFVSSPPPAHLLAFIADQVRINPKSFENYAQRDETRREHLAELQAYLGMRSFGRQDYRIMARIAFNESIGTDRGDAIVGAMVVLGVETEPHPLTARQLLSRVRFPQHLH
jgi:hypothetical protein